MLGQIILEDSRQQYALLADALMNGRLVPFLGAGVNLCDRPPKTIWKPLDQEYLPNGRELAQYLANAFRFPGGQNCSVEGCPLPSPALDLAKVSQYGETVLGTGRLYDELHSVLAQKFSPTSAHHFLAELRLLKQNEHLLIVSTNYDDLMEQALGEGNFDLVAYDPDDEPPARFWHTAPGKKPSRIDSANDYPYVFFRDRPVVLKIHGTIDRFNQDRAGFVITEDHYIGYLAEEPLEKLLPPSLLKKMRNHHVLFLGYSLRDWNLRVFLRRLKRKPKQRYNSWAVLLHTDEAETKFWWNNGVDIINLELKAFIEELQNELTLRTEPGTTGGSVK